MLCSIEKDVTSPILAKLGEVERAVSSINEKLEFLHDIKKNFECIICHLPCKTPVVASCCQQIVGCNDCVTRWRQTNSRCSLCSVGSSTTSCFILKGVDGITSIFRVSEDREVRAEVTIDVDTGTLDDSSNELEQLSSFRTSNSAS